MIDECKSPEFVPVHEVRETDKEFRIDNMKIKGVGIDSVKTKPFGDGVIITLSFLAKSYVRD